MIVQAIGSSRAKVIEGRTAAARFSGLAAASSTRSGESCASVGGSTASIVLRVHDHHREHLEPGQDEGEDPVLVT